MRRSVISVFVVLATVSASCGGGDGDGSAPTTRPASVTTTEGGVERGVVAIAGGGLAASEDSSVLYDQSLLATYELVLSEENLAILDADPAAEMYVEGDLIVAGERFDDVGIRYKGSIGSFAFCLDGGDVQNPDGERTCTKLSIKVDIDRYVEGRELTGLRKLQFHSMNLDPTHLRERIAYWMFAEAGVPAPRASHARVVLNGEYLGLFSFVEQVDGRFTRRVFDDGTGNLYKETWPFNSVGEVQLDEEFELGLRTNEDDAPSFELTQAFARELAAAGEDKAAVEAVLRARTDFDTLISWLAVDLLIDNDDGPRHWYCFDFCGNHNYYLYEEPATGRVHMIPWDMDNAFENLVVERNLGITIADDLGEVSADCAPFLAPRTEIEQRSAVCDPLWAALALFLPEVEARTAELLTGPLRLEAVHAQLDAWAEQIEPAVIDAAVLHDDAPPVATWTAAVARLRNDLATLYR